MTTDGSPSRFGRRARPRPSETSTAVLDRDEVAGVLDHEVLDRPGRAGVDGDDVQEVDRELDLGGPDPTQASPPPGAEAAAASLDERTRSAMAGFDIGADAPTARRLSRNPLRAVSEAARDYSLLRRTPYGFGPAGIIGVIYFVQALDSAALTLAGPEIVRDLGLRITDIVDIQIFVGTVALLVALPVGWYADRHRRVPIFAVGTLLSGVFSVLSSRGSSILTLGAPRVADDVADKASSIPTFSLLADYYPPESRGRVFAFLGTMNRIGALTSIIAIGLAVEYLGWRTAIVLAGLPLVGLGLLALLRLREPVRGYFERRELGASDEVAATEDEALSFGEAWRATFAVRTLRRLFISDMVSIAGVALYALYAPFFFADEYGLGPFQRSLVGLPGLLGALAGGLIGGTLIDRVIGRNPARVLVIIGAFSSVSALIFLPIAFTPPIVVLLVLLAVFSFFSALIGPASSAVYTQVVPPAIRTQAGQITALAAIPGLVLFTPIGKAIFADNGYQGVFLYAVPLLLVGGLIAISAGAFFELDRRNALSASLASEEARVSRAAGGAKLLVCRDVDVAYDGVQVLFGVDFDVDEGEIIALLGTNGAGKSTLLRAITGTTEASSGAIVVDGRDTTHMPAHEIAGRGVIFMPGGRGVFPGLSVKDNLLLAGWMTPDPVDVRNRLAETYGIFPVLEERGEALAGSLSGGEQQQLSLAQAFLANPKLLLIDELSLGLSPAVVGQLIEIVKEINRRGVTVVVVEQSVNVALTLARRAVFMEKGEVRFFGATAELLARPDILRAVYVKGTGALTDSAPGGARRTSREQRSLDLAGARPVLEVEGIEKGYGGVTAVDGVTFDLRDGEVLGLIGPNGAGKTTLFDIISGHQPADAGVIRYEGVDITGLRPEERARRKLIRRFQDARLFPSLTVYETLLVSLEQRLEVRSTLLNAVRAPQARKAERRVRARADALVEILELGAYRDKFVKELSTGLRRIVDLACVLAAEPKVLLLDEPSSGIAQAEAEGLAPLLTRVRFETGCSILIIEHDMPLISAVSDELIALDQGRFVVRGAPEVVLDDERVIESYLGTTEAAVQRSGTTGAPRP